MIRLIIISLTNLAENIGRFYEKNILVVSLMLYELCKKCNINYSNETAS